MSGRTTKHRERGRACWGPEARVSPPGVTAAQRELLRDRLLADPAFFLDLCARCGVVSLCQLPCWPEICERLPLEAQEIARLARAAGIHA